MDDETAVSTPAAGTADLDARLDGTLDITAAQLIKEVKERQEARFAVPQGAFTLRQFMDATGWREKRARNALKVEVEANRLEMRKWPQPSGGIMHIWMKVDSDASQ